MARRLKNMLGEYISEEDNNIYDFEDIADKAQTIPTSIFADSNPVKSKVCDENILSNQVNDEKKEIEEPSFLNETVCENIPPVESEKQDTNAEVEPGHISSRRSSLKRQCKEKISLLDYNPMFTIRNKRTKPNSSLQRPKISKCTEVSQLIFIIL